jgi:hypothetical protein
MMVYKRVQTGMLLPKGTRRLLLIASLVTVTAVLFGVLFSIETEFSESDVSRVSGNAGMQTDASRNACFSGGIYNGTDRKISSFIILISASQSGIYTESWVRRFEVKQEIEPLSTGRFSIPMSAYHGSVTWQILSISGPVKIL